VKPQNSTVAAGRPDGVHLAMRPRSLQRSTFEWFAVVPSSVFSKSSVPPAFRNEDSRERLGQIPRRCLWDFGPIRHATSDPVGENAVIIWRFARPERLRQPGTGNSWSLGGGSVPGTLIAPVLKKGDVQPIRLGPSV